jgi:hypothetical protein
LVTEVEFSIHTHGESFTFSSVVEAHIDSKRINDYVDILSSLRHIHSVTSPRSADSFTAYFSGLVSKFSTAGIEGAAIKAAEDFQTPHDAIDRDLFSFLDSQSLDQFITVSQSRASTSGISPERFEHTFSTECPDFQRALQIAHSGVIIDPPVGFLPIDEQLEHRPVVSRMPNVIMKLVHKLWLEGKGVYLPRKYLPPSSGLHINPIHWVSKPTNPMGRFLIDATDASSKHVPLNGLGAKELSIQRYGRIQHPLIHDIITAWYLHMSSTGQDLSQMFIWKEDIEGCFPQMPLHHSAAKLSAVLLPNDVLFITTMGYL